MEQKSSREAGLFGNLKNRYHVHKSPLLDHMNETYTLIPYLIKIRINIIFTFTPR
jgi:hypothetical protein